jgi:hypothetical protein
MEPDEDRIKSISDNTSATEAEVRALHLIQAAGRALRELPIDRGRAIQFTVWQVHIDALLNSVLARIATRDHPGVWPQPQENEQDEI